MSTKSDEIEIAPGILIRRVGLIERGPKYRWVDGWAIVVDGREYQPWLTKREATKLAKEIAQKLS